MAYQGWANRATWNVMLWLRNDENLYSAMMYYVLGVRGRITARDAELVVRDLFPTGETPDGYNLVDVRWGEIARAMMEEA